MTKYKQLSQEQRYVIGRLLKAGKDKAEIATAIGVDRSTHLAQGTMIKVKHYLKKISSFFEFF